MIREACLELLEAAVSDPKFQETLNTLTHALKNGRHWAKLANNFGDGIIALIPLHPAFGPTNTKHIEDVPDKAFQALLSMLEGHRAESLHSLGQSLSVWMVFDIDMAENPGDVEQKVRIRGIPNHRNCEFVPLDVVV